MKLGKTFWMRLLAALLVLLAISSPTLAADGSLTLLELNDTEGGQELSIKLQILLLMTLLGFLPAMLMMMTCFTRFIIVMAILRQAIGLQQSPPNQVLIGIALCLTLLVMRPVGQEIYEQAYAPFEADEITLQQGLDAAKYSLSRFMAAQTNGNSLATILELTGQPMPDSLEELDFFVLLPAFVLSELKTAFLIGFTLFIPFLIIDLIVSSVLMAMGMMMLSPMMISLPFKLMIFVLVDGWDLLVGTLTASIQPF